MKCLYLIPLLATEAQKTAALTQQQERVISATGFALFVGDYYYPACEQYELEDEAVQSAWRSAGLNPDRYIAKIKALADLSGHRVGVVGRTQVNTTLLRVILRESGVNPDKVEVAQFGADAGFYRNASRFHGLLWLRHRSVNRI